MKTALLEVTAAHAPSRHRQPGRPPRPSRRPRPLLQPRPGRPPRRRLRRRQRPPPPLGNAGQTPPPDKISITNVGPTWGSSITNKAIEALIIFFIVVAIYISFRFEPKMALAAFIAMIHDVLVAIGIYSIFNFQVTPDTVVAILTILGYSLYDTVVVFDRVPGSLKGIGSSGRLTYPQLINLSMNQTLARSINTSMVAIIPVLAILLIGAGFLGAQTLQSYGLGPLRRPALGGLLVDLHRLTGALHDEGARGPLGADRQPAGQAGRLQGVVLRSGRRQPEHGHQRRRLGAGSGWTGSRSAEGPQQAQRSDPARLGQRGPAGGAGRGLR